MLVVFALVYLKNPFSNPWAQKLKLEPPARLTDPKYGVHKYIKVNVSIFYKYRLPILFLYATGDEFHSNADAISV